MVIASRAQCLLWWLVAVPLTVQAVGAQADDPAAARQAFEEGAGAAMEERWPAAADAFARSLALSPRPNTRHNLAVALCKLQRYAECLGELQVFLSGTDHARNAEHQAIAQALYDKTLAAVGRLNLNVQPASASVTVDGELVADTGAERMLYAQPGEHALLVSAPGYVSIAIPWMSLAGQTTTEFVRLHPEVAPAIGDGPVVGPVPAEPLPSGSRVPTATDRTGPIILLAGAGVLGAGALVTGTLAKRADNQVVDACDGAAACAKPELEGVQDRALTLGVVTDVLWIGGVVAATTGLIWLLDLDDVTQSTAALAITPKAAAMTWRTRF